MEANVSLKQGTYDVAMQGKFTFSDHNHFRDILQKIGETQVAQVVLDMRAVEFIDSAAMGMLLLARDEAEKHSKPLTISGAVGQVKKMFDVARFDTLFTIS